LGTLTAALEALRHPKSEFFSKPVILNLLIEALNALL